MRVSEIARDVVKSAASQVRTEPARSWLRMDERGTWESIARDIVEKHPETFVKHGDEAVRQAGNLLAVAALETVLGGRR
jgi:hypothetical protein